jgi:hypothetical protein
MKRMSMLKDHDRRITELEGCFGDVKEVLASHGESIYDMKRKITRADLRWRRLFERFNLEDITEEEVDEVLDAE